MNCEDFLIQKFALLDGEKTDVAASEIDAHFDLCENCRREIAALEGAVRLLEKQARSAPPVDLWAAISRRVETEPQAAFTVGWQPFAAVGALLFIYKLFEMLPERDFGWVLRLVPLVIAAALFGLLKENPFKIKTDLVPEEQL